MKRNKLLLFVATLLLMSFTLFKLKQKPTVYIIGDSTVKNTDGTSNLNLHWGWGSLIAPYFDTTKVGFSNNAKPGTSTRTFINNGLWEKVLSALRPGDFVVMQFGHNDNGPLDDTSRARGTIKGIGNEVKEIYNPIKKQQETVHTYGWYLTKMISEAKAKGASVIVCSLVPRDKWKDAKVVEEHQYPLWAKQTAEATNSCFIDLNKIIIDKWEKLGQEGIKLYFTTDHTHTNLEGAKVNAASFVEGLQGLKDCPLNKYLK